MAGAAIFSYDVFLSFRGEDTRLNFTGNFYSALIQKGIRTFFDDEELRKGEELTPALEKAIQDSRVAIVVLSKDYASSSFCLDELTTILDCYEQKKVQLVLSVFYDVDPSNVRHQTGSYGEALAKHEVRFKDNPDKVKKWKMALQQTANLIGFHFKPGVGYEYKFIRSILEVVSTKINRTLLHVANYPVGLESRVDEVKTRVNVQSESDDEVRMVGIHGIGGVGKSTIARSVYNSIYHHFEGLCCFLEDVRVNSAKYGLVCLQETVLSEILGDKHITLGSVNNGKIIILQRLRKKRVLLVLDDVDDLEQLQALVGSLDWFGVGSRVIITTQDKGILTKHGVKSENTCKVDGLSFKDARKLISWNAFRTDKVDPSYDDLLDRAVTCASNLPLALEVIGSSLCGKGKEEWIHVLDNYERNLHKKIQDRLSVSLDSLEEKQKEIFLDIACCFGGYKLSDIEDILHAHHDSPIKHGIEVLIEKSLIKIDDDDFVTLHELIQEMGRAIVRKESKEPGERSRLWSREEVVRVLQGNLGTSKIQILILDSLKDEVPEGEVLWDWEAIMKMINLKTLINKNCHFSTGPTRLPDSLRVLKWSEYPSPSLPCYFHPRDLSVLELPGNRLNPCEPIKMFTSLTVLDFSCSQCVTEIPNVSDLQNLKKLSFRRCDKLEKIDPSVGYLENLKILDAFSCNKLETFPSIKLTSLEQLNLSHCSILKSFPEILGKMENITELHIMGTSIEKLPFSIQNLTRLQKLELQTRRKLQLPSSIVMLPNLGLMRVSECQGLYLDNQEQCEEMVSKSSKTECLILSNCSLLDKLLPIVLTWFANVKDLNLSGNNFTLLDTCFKECHNLRNLKLDDCRNLQKIRGIPWKLETFSARGCMVLKYLDLTVVPACTGKSLSLKKLILDECKNLEEITGDLSKLDHFSSKNCTSLTPQCKSMLLNQESVEAGNKMFFLPGTKIPEWFTHSTRGESICFWFRNKFPAVSLCLVIELTNERQYDRVKFSPRVSINGNKLSLGSREVYQLKIETDHIFLFDIQLLLRFEDNVDMVFSEIEWNPVEVSFADHITNNEIPIRLVAKHGGIHVFQQLTCMEDILFKDPNRKRKSDLSTLEPKNDLSLKEKRTFVDMEFSEVHYTQNQQHVGLLTRHVDHRSEQFLSLPFQEVKTVNCDQDSMEGPSQGVNTTSKKPRIDHTLVLSSSILPLIPPPPTEAEKGLTSRPTPSVERLWKDVGGEASERLLEDEVHRTTIQNEQCSSNSKGSDSDGPFHRAEKLLSVCGKETISSLASSGDASLTSITEAIATLELLTAKDLSEVSSDCDMQCQLDRHLDLLSRSSHRRVTVELKEAIVEFKTKAFASFQDFQTTVEPVKRLKNFEEQRERIQEEISEGKKQWKDLKNTRKKASVAIERENNRMEELKAEIAALNEQLATKEKDLEQHMLNVNKQKAELSTYSKNGDSLREQARVLAKKANDLHAESRGIEEEGKAAEVKQNGLKSTWATDRTSLLDKINNILGT